MYYVYIRYKEGKDFCGMYNSMYDYCEKRNISIPITNIYHEQDINKYEIQNLYILLSRLEEKDTIIVPKYTNILNTSTKKMNKYITKLFKDKNINIITPL